MADYTNEIGLYLPSTEDNVDVVGSLRTNFEKIDTYIADKMQELQEVQTRINTLEEATDIEEANLSGDSPYIRYKNGVQIVWKPRFTISTRRGNTENSYRMEDQMDFPVPFHNGEEVHASANIVYYNNGSRLISFETNNHLRVREVTKTNCLIAVGRSDGESNQQYPTGVSVLVSVMAIGRWKA